MQTGIIRPSENIKTHNNELYFTNNGVYGKPKRGEYIIVPKEHVTFSNTLNKHVNFKTPDNILTENFNFYTPTIFGRLRKVKTNPIKLID
jgi:hypothetical protein